MHIKKIAIFFCTAVVICMMLFAAIANAAIMGQGTGDGPISASSQLRKQQIKAWLHFRIAQVREMDLARCEERRPMMAIVPSRVLEVQQVLAGAVSLIYLSKGLLLAVKEQPSCVQALDKVNLCQSRKAKKPQKKI